MITERDSLAKKIMTWDGSFGLSKGSPSVFKNFKIVHLKALIFNRAALDAKPASLIRKMLL
jgi:hypothetical protein